MVRHGLFHIKHWKERFGNETHYRAEETRTEGGSFGTSRNMDGTEGEMAVAVRALGQRLEDVGFTVDFWDERLTSRLVSRQDPRSLKKAIKDKGKVDLMSAVLILQEYINARRRTNEPQ